jgi:hypothetical protein
MRRPGSGAFPQGRDAATSQSSNRENGGAPHPDRRGAVTNGRGTFCVVPGCFIAFVCGVKEMKTLAARTTGLAPADAATSADDVARAAMEMIRRYPEDAIIRAEACYDALLALGKVEKALDWWHVKAAIARLHAGSPVSRPEDRHSV